VIECSACGRPIVAALMDAHQRRVHGDGGWFAQRVPVATGRPGLGSRSRTDRTPNGGEGRPQRRWKRPRGAGPYR